MNYGRIHSNHTGQFFYPVCKELCIDKLLPINKYNLGCVLSELSLFQDHFIKI